MGDPKEDWKPGSAVVAGERVSADLGTSVGENAGFYAGGAVELAPPWLGRRFIP